MSDPLVTIAIPSYNHAKYISETINSILNQSYTNFELLIVDDASTDNSVEIIKSFKDPRIKLITLKKNGGMCNAGNICIENAKGKYISLIASDDIMKKEKTEKQVKFLEENKDYGAVFSTIECIDENGKILEKKTKRYKKVFTSDNKSREEWLRHFFFYGNSIAAPTMMVITECLKKINGFDIRLSQAHDFDKWIKICLSGYNICVIPENLVQYRKISGNKNLSSNTLETQNRLLFDNEAILKNYLFITNKEELIRIFPNLEKEKITKDTIPFLIAIEASKIKNTYYHMQFAIEVLYDILGNKKIRETLKNNFNFTLKDFFNLTANNPIGMLKEKLEEKSIRRKIKKIGKFFRI